MPRRRRTRRSFVTGIAVVAALAIVTTALTVLALRAVEPTPQQQAAQPAPTFSFGSPEPTATVTAEPPAAVVVDRAEQRTLVFGTAPGVAWRAIEGSCAEGIAPMIERSADGGVTWNDVTPTYRDVRQVLTLESFAGNQAQAIMVVGDDCTVDGLRTFTQGRFWEPYGEVLAQSTYVSPAQESTIITPDGQVTAPCAEPRDVRASNGTLLLVCGGDLQQVIDGDWVASGYSGVDAHARDADDALYVAWRATGCDGIAISPAAPALLTVGACISAPQAQPATAIAVTGTDAWVWTGDTVTAVELGD
jgi:hypothetical protein